MAVQELVLEEMTAEELLAEMVREGTPDTLRERLRERIVERAKEAWRETEGLSQTRAGRVRMVAEQTLHLLAERTTLKAREDVKVKGEKIYLG